MSGDLRVLNLMPIERKGRKPQLELEVSRTSCRDARLWQAE
jgi:hypothetical protein